MGRVRKRTRKNVMKKRKKVQRGGSFLVKRGEGEGEDMTHDEFAQFKVKNYDLFDNNPELQEKFASMYESENKYGYLTDPAMLEDTVKFEIELDTREKGLADQGKPLKDRGTRNQDEGDDVQQETKKTISETQEIIPFTVDDVTKLVIGSLSNKEVKAFLWSTKPEYNPNVDLQLDYSHNDCILNLLRLMSMLPLINFIKAYDSLLFLFTWIVLFGPTLTQIVQEPSLKSKERSENVKLEADVSRKISLNTCRGTFGGIKYFGRSFFKNGSIFQVFEKHEKDVKDLLNRVIYSSKDPNAIRFYESHKERITPLQILYYGTRDFNSQKMCKLLFDCCKECFTSKSSLYFNDYQVNQVLLRLAQNKSIDSTQYNHITTHFRLNKDKIIRFVYNCKLIYDMGNESEYLPKLYPNINIEFIKKFNGQLNSINKIFTSTTISSGGAKKRKRKARRTRKTVRRSRVKYSKLKKKMKNTKMKKTRRKQN
jgi:hypothetical protein